MRSIIWIGMISLLWTSVSASAQAVKGMVPEDAPARALTFNGLTPGADNHAKVRELLGEPEFESKWYSYKLYYPAKDRPGLYDVLHMGGKSPDAHLANIDAASIPKGYETESKIRAAMGEPEYELRMATWRMLDYTKEGLRFSITSDGNTTGVAYFPHTTTRVPAGERKLMDLSHLRQGPQPAPAKKANWSGMKVGISEKVISPQGEDWLPHRYKIHDDLKVRIAVFKNDDESVAFVGADNFGMGWKDVNVMRDGAKALGVNHLIFGMSHNHATGDTIGVYGHYPTEYIAHIQSQVIASVKEALGDLEEITELRAASKELPMDGIRVQDLFRNARNPGVLDPTISLIQAIGKNGKVITTMVNFACHVESLEKGSREVSADFPGYMCDQITRDGGGLAVFLNGAVGGMVSGDNRARTHESAEEMGLQLASIVKEMVPTTQPMVENKFSVDQRLLQIPMTNPNFKERYESGIRSIYRGRITTDMIYVQLGDAQFVTLPGELLPEVSFEILEQMDGFPRVLIGLANDQIGYMVPPYDFRIDAYEESVSQGPAAATQVRDMAIRMLQGKH
ncbi:MAG: hypothetical protein VCD00_04205 [Candidatus Hydrogenedentota bacterium]